MAESRTKRAATMHDVARRAGVSQTTVSFVINGRKDISISDETRERVQEAVRELNFRPNAMARSLRSKKSHFIGLISDEIATTPHAGQIIKGAQDTAWAQGKLLLLINTGGDETLKIAAANALLERQVESVIYATMYHRPVNPPAILRQVPTVLLDCFVPDRTLPSVAPDEVQGGRTATEHLLSLEHRRVGFVNNFDAIPAAVGRLEGYRQALAAYDVTFDETLVSAGVSEASGGYRGVMELMRRDQPPTAIFLFNDRMAMGAYDALRNLGISINKDVAIVGFDNEEIIAAHLYPPLTTVQLPHYEMGQWAVDYQLAHSADSPVGLPIQHKIPCPLVRRT